MVDVNCAFDVTGAERFAAEIQDLRPTWIEEPLFPPDDFEGPRALSQRIDVPLALGENIGTAGEFERVLGQVDARYAQPSAIKTGGITALLRVARAARAHGVLLMPHSAYFGPGLLATLHVLATLEGSNRSSSASIAASPRSRAELPRE